LLKRRFLNVCVYIYVCVCESPIPKIGCQGNGFIVETNVMSLKYVEK
jgi:hypothetical protein